ncbi:Crp/Fnr family transcriptional regulator [Streptomyces sp. 769]|uniref:Crp/Fnr family transcriptional regulator n=1 Tax=Streptomyces sp. 769 TaxID=1262452 RepID=UPI00057D9BB1|nr:Crp/Fnr family transcriptional regulator [Streptomyces sp. 769]AJC54731.1 Crp family transcriptional regulator [Streptomyces sp. 769]
MATLARTTLFQSLGEDALLSVARSCVSRNFSRGQFLFYQGDPGDRLFIIVSGLVKVVFTSVQGDELVLATLGPREVVGEMAVLDQVPRSASVIATKPTRALLLNRPVLLGLMHTHPPVMDALLKLLGGLVRRLTEQTGELAFLDLRGRLASVLLRLAHERGLAGAPAVLDLGLTQSDLGTMIGASRPAVNRGLQSLASSGLIELRGPCIALIDPAGLRRQSGN